MSVQQAVQLLSYHKSLEMLFSASAYWNSDHILRTFHRHDIAVDLQNFQLRSNQSTYLKFFCLYTLESDIKLELEILWQLNAPFCAAFCLALLSQRAVADSDAYQKRHIILQWLPEKLLTLTDISLLPYGILHDVYMHCSYDDAVNKHLIKRSLNHIFRLHLLQDGWRDRTFLSTGKINNKPIMLVLLEHFSTEHSIYRTHSRSLLAAKARFHLVGIGRERHVDQAGRAIFDQFVELQQAGIPEQMAQLRTLAESLKPAVFYMPSLGMDLITLYASVVRIAAVQVIALGHPATSHSDFIDYALVEEDYTANNTADFFSEKLIKLPNTALPYISSGAMKKYPEHQFRENPNVVQIGIASSIMKINPHFLSACQEILKRTNTPIHFRFICGLSFGSTHVYLDKVIKRYLGNSATLYSHRPYDDYLAELNQCDMLINPFPFGNTNGIIDMVLLGLVGVCKTGSEVHEHIDEGLFNRLKLPKWLIASNVEQYITSAVKLAEDHQLRLSIRKELIRNAPLKRLFEGQPDIIGEILWQKTALSI
ncbi:adhesin [Testudinibacter sp. TR-2022]|nr:adhesin [Testudinibacter sp. TR-2022]TNH11113.1 adhesin [Testudinibacter sp. TR-2022]TNH13393.1 adhesin [Testudinibacter sp. TR-2022]TNH19501.1 adhesin [Testudinibacter sp. TR-2022]